MTDGIGIVVGSTPGATTPANAAPVSSRAAATTPFAVNTNTATAPASIAPSPLLHSPRIVQDPAAGLITQYLNTNGTQVVSQTPSEVTVSYLRQGLSADGLPKQTEGHINTTA